MSFSKMIGLLSVALMFVSGVFAGSNASAQTIQLDGQRIKVQSGSNHDIVSVLQVGNQIAVTVFEFDPTVPAPPPTLTPLQLAVQSIGTSFQTFAVVDVAEIEIITLGGNDTIVIDPAITLPSDIMTGIGHDLVFGGSGPDIVLGGFGDDILIGFDGRDILLGGPGMDALEGGEDGETDILMGGLGADVFFSFYESGQVIVEQDLALDLDVNEGDLDDEGVF